jgi:mycothiol synthase
LAEVVAGFDGVAALSEASLLALTGDDDVIHLTLAEDHLVGYAQLRREGADFGPAELLVDPAARGSGRGAALLAAALSEGAPGVWAHGELPAALALGRSAGLVVLRTLALLARPVRGLPAAGPTPPGFAVRSYRGGDDDACVLRVNARAFADLPDQGSWGPAELGLRMAAPWFDPAGLLVLTTAGADRTVVGFHWTKVITPREGEVYVIAVDPHWHGHGLGRFLLLAGLDELRSRGVERVSLFCDGANAAALGLYRSMGFRVERNDVVLGPEVAGNASAARLGPSSGRLGA